MQDSAVGAELLGTGQSGTYPASPGTWGHEVFHGWELVPEQPGAGKVRDRESG